MKIESILVPMDFSDAAQAAIDYAVRVAKESGAEIHLLHSYPVSPGIATPYGPALPDAVFQSIRSGAEAKLADAKKRVEREGITTTAHLTAEPPSFAISEAAEELGVDCIVMGTRGLSGLKHVLLGSVAERTVRTAPCPVFTVPIAQAAA